MRTILSRYALSMGAAAALLAACSAARSPVTPLIPGVEQRVDSSASEKVLHRFPHGTRYPDAGLVDINGTLYGTTHGAGTDHGTVYTISLNGVVKTLFRFNGADGSNPSANVIDVNGTLYGTTSNGGASNLGVVYSLTAKGVEKVLHSFAGGRDGANPAGGLTNVNGTLYGTTLIGGSNYCYLGEGCGTVYSVTTTGAERVLHRFETYYGSQDGASPDGTLLDVNGVLYGTTIWGGNAWGTVFSITTKGKEKVLYRFKGRPDGFGPGAGVIAVNGTLYGTTQGGGNGGSPCQFGFVGSCGTIFSVSTTGTEHVIYRFQGGLDGEWPASPLLDSKGTLYGTTSGDGVDCGIVYKTSPSGTEQPLYGFKGGSDGCSPGGGLVDVSATLYGTTVVGGEGKGCNSNGCGTVFALTP
ncbi:MAG: hypothetical protein JO146_01220 [Candidatus Eremiobacteraeota bacterium]|nr:hypothetical protein [Candidatus Eremiobacteraeota bacterium]